MRQKRKRLLFPPFIILFLILVASVCAISMPLASAVISPSISGALGYSGYDPATLSVFFPHTTLITTNVSNNGGYYTYAVSTGSPTSSITYNFNASDVYTVTLGIEYPTAFSGNITYQFTGPVLLPLERTFQFFNQTSITLSWLVELENYIAPPNEQQIAQATSGFLISHLDTVIAFLNNSQTQFQQFTGDQISNLTFVSSAAIIFSACAVVFVFLMYRKISGSLSRQ